MDIPELVKTKRERAFREFINNLGILCIMVVVILLLGMFFLSSARWIKTQVENLPISHDTPVWIHGDWIIGEYRICQMQTTTPPPGITLTPEVQAELPRLFCDEGQGGSIAFLYELREDPQAMTAAVNAISHGGDWNEFDGKFHVLPVSYHGPIDKSGKVLVFWRCQRKSDSLECWIT